MAPMILWRLRSSVNRSSTGSEDFCRTSGAFHRTIRSGASSRRSSPRTLSAVFGRGLAGLQEKTDGEVVAIDGKTACGSGDRASGTEQLHLVEAWATEQELMLGQRRSEDGSTKPPPT